MNKIQNSQPEYSRSFWISFLLGVGIIAAIDEIVFHQLLAWHHFYDRSTPAIALLSDGILHASELIAIVAGFFLFSDLRRRSKVHPLAAWSGFFSGMGVFQLFDGIVDHKVLRVHQVRYEVDNLFIYDLSWNLAGLILLLIGIGIGLRARAQFKVNTQENRNLS